MLSYNLDALMLEFFQKKPRNSLAENKLTDATYARKALMRLTLITLMGTDPIIQSQTVKLCAPTVMQKKLGKKEKDSSYVSSFSDSAKSGLISVASNKSA